MADANKFFSKYWCAIAWTVFYVLFMWMVLYFLFNFNIFSILHWIRLTRVELHGFPGLVFGVLILAAVPLYIATTVLTMRNKLMPVKIPLPKCFEPVVKVTEPEPAPPVVTEQEILPNLHTGIPAEMRESFSRARKNYGVRQMSVFNKPMMVNAIEMDKNMPTSTAEMVATVPVMHDMANEMSHNMSAVDVADTAFPIPTDFDVEPSVESEYGVPVFADINFDDDADSDSDNVAPIDDLCEFLNGAGCPATKADNDLITVGNFIIATHGDEDFWVADDENWFAAGKQKPSPIVALQDACSKNNALHPILYLGTQNIMDVDVQIEKWRTAGTDIVTDRDELLKIIKSE